MIYCNRHAVQSPEEWYLLEAADGPTADGVYPATVAVRRAVHKCVCVVHQKVT